MGSPQHPFRLTISDLGRGTKDRRHLDRTKDLTLGVAGGGTGLGYAITRSPPADSPRWRRLVDRVARPSSDASGCRFQAPCGPVSDGLRTASEDGIAGTELGVIGPKQPPGPGASLKLARSAHGERSLSARFREAAR